MKERQGGRDNELQNKCFLAARKNGCADTEEFAAQVRSLGSSALFSASESVPAWWFPTRTNRPAVSLGRFRPNEMRLTHFLCLSSCWKTSSQMTTLCF